MEVGDNLILVNHNGIKVKKGVHYAQRSVVYDAGSESGPVSGLPTCTNPLRATPAVTTPWSAVKVSHKVGLNLHG